MYHRKMEKQTRSVKSVKTPTLPELYDDNKRSQLLPQVQAFNQLTPDRSMPDRSMLMSGRSIPMPAKTTPMPRNKHSWHQLPHSSDAMMIHLVPTDCMREISSGTSSVTDSKITTHHIPIWEPLSPS
jgi:hypothetical protein